MFRFLTQQAGDSPEPLQTQKTASAWFRQLPSVDVIGRQQHVMRAFDALRRSPKPVEFDHVAAVEFLDAKLDADRGQLITQYVETVDGSGALADRIWLAAYEISQGFIVAYRTLLDEAIAQANDARWKAAIPRLIARLIHFYGTDAKLRALRSERWISAKWVELHQLYVRAGNLGVERVPLPPSRGAVGESGRTVEQEYLSVLMTHLLNTGTVAPAEIDWAGAQVRAWSRELGLDEAPRTANGFVVDVGGRTGLVRRSGDERGSTLRYLDTTPLTERLEGEIAALRRPGGGAPDPAGMLNLQRARTLEKLLPVVSADVPPRVPRDPRIAVNRAVQVRTGLVRICEELAPSDTRNRAIETGAGGEQIAPHAAATPGAPNPAPTAPMALPDEPLWRVENRSGTGLRIAASGGIGHGLALGSLVAVREPDAADWMLGAIRRVIKARSDEVEAGVAIIATRIIAVTLHAKTQAREDMGFVVDGVDVSTIGERFDGLYVPPPSRPAKPLAAKTLVIPTSEYIAGRSLVLITGRTVYTVALRDLLEQRHDWSWAVIEIVATAPRG